MVGPEQVVIKGFTLLEILVVIIIIGILATLALPNFGKAKEYALDKEASANLKLMAAAERIYRMETSSYYGSGTTQPQAIININDNLKLSISAGDKRNWNYLTKDTGCAQATRIGGDERNWFLAINDADGESDSGTCP